MPQEHSERLLYKDGSALKWKARNALEVCGEVCGIT